jgi:bifunctional DNA-binding transcriptional regulator/antitoxin component of YhaV-PrlF toxin-antitoxin module
VEGVVIPATLRQKYGLSPGARLQAVDYGGMLALIPAVGDTVEAAASMLAGGDLLTEALLGEHHREIENEQ